MLKSQLKQSRRNRPYPSGTQALLSLALAAVIFVSANVAAGTF